MKINTTLGRPIWELNGDTPTTSVNVEDDPALIDDYKRNKEEFEAIQCRIENLFFENFKG